MEFDQPAWSWKGGWSTETVKNDWSSWKVKRAAGAGDEATFAFEGTGVAIAGTMTQEGGRADVYLDGVRKGEIDAWIPEGTYDNDYWHVTGLPERQAHREDRGARRRRRPVEGPARPAGAGDRLRPPPVSPTPGSGAAGT